MLVFVGDKPSKDNIDPKVAFVGTKSYKTLLNWIAEMDINIADVKLINKDDIGSCTKADRFIALGAAAIKELKKYSVGHFALPHPSGLNRALNDKKKLKAKLKECKEWIKFVYRKDPLHISPELYTVYFKGKPQFTLNKALLDRQNVWDRLEDIKNLHVMRLLVEESLTAETDQEIIKGLVGLWTQNQFLLQQAWGFEQDAKFHRFWDIPACQCPKMDNNDAYPTGYYVTSGGCTIHKHLMKR